MLAALIRDAPKTICLSSMLFTPETLRRSATNGKADRHPITLMIFRFGAPAPRSGLDRSTRRAYKGNRPARRDRVGLRTGNNLGLAWSLGSPSTPGHRNTWAITTVAGDPAGTCRSRYPWQGIRPFPVCRR